MNAPKKASSDILCTNKASKKGRIGKFPPLNPMAQEAVVNNCAMRSSIVIIIGMIFLPQARLIGKCSRKMMKEPRKLQSKKLLDRPKKCISCIAERR